MSEVVLASLIATLSSIVTAAITAFAPVLLEIIKQQSELEKRAQDLDDEQRNANVRGEKSTKRRKRTHPIPIDPANVGSTPLKPKINRQLTGVKTIFIRCSLIDYYSS